MICDGSVNCGRVTEGKEKGIVELERGAAAGKDPVGIGNGVEDNPVDVVRETAGTDGSVKCGSSGTVMAGNEAEPSDDNEVVGVGPSDRTTVTAAGVTRVTAEGDVMRLG